MYNFYKKVVVVFLILMVVTALTTCVCLEYAFVRDQLLPAQNSAIPWELTTASDAETGGASTIAVNDSTFTVDFNFNVKNEVQYPYVSYTLAFDDLDNPKQFADLSTYSTLFFRVKCNPENILSFVVYIYDPKITRPAELSTYRIAVAYFSCAAEWTEVEIDMKHLQVPEWWLDSVGLDLSDIGYQLENAMAFSFGISRQTPVNKPSNVKIVDLTLCGWSWRYVFVLSFFVIIVWVGFIYWLYRQHTRRLIDAIQQKVRKDLPLIAYRQLSIESHKDKDKQLILQLIAEEYTDPNLGLDTVVTKLGISRTKINEILKTEVGFTFSAYLNKLRLSEAARLLSENDEINVAEIAYSVGYNNASYFNKLFKNEYGCTPKSFKKIYEKNNNE